jgi:hypothetical protein
VYNLITKEIVRKIGTGENFRFLGLALCRAIPSITEKLQGAAPTANMAASENPIFTVGNEPDPMLVFLLPLNFMDIRICKKQRLPVRTNETDFTCSQTSNPTQRRQMNKQVQVGMFSTKNHKKKT